MEQCKKLSGLLFGQLIYTTAEMLPIATLVVYVICVAVFSVSHSEVDKIFLMLTIPSINFALLPTIQVFATPAIRSDLKQCLIRLIRSCCKISPPPRPNGDIDMRQMNGNPEILGQRPVGAT